MWTFQSYQFRQINPDLTVGSALSQLAYAVSIVSIQADQSRPRQIQICLYRCNRVSIVSIQADQSRRVQTGNLWQVIGGFNRINSGRSIPTNVAEATQTMQLSFQSYQFRQINPDEAKAQADKANAVLVSIVSIQADQSRLNFVNPTKCSNNKFQSYQFRQINPD